MKDPEWLQKFLNKISDALGVPQISANEKILDSLREEMCWIKNNPEKAADGCRFVILHEFGHINDPNLSRGKQIGTAIAIVLAGLTSTVLVFTISVFLVEASTMALGIILTSGAAAASLVVIVVTGVTISIIAMKILQIKVGRRREIFADNFAAGVLKGDEGKKIRQGGIYFFQKDRSEIGLYQKLTDLHPTPRERIRMLENYIEESS